MTRASEIREQLFLAAALIASQPRRDELEGDASASPGASSALEARVELVQRLLEEMGVHCEESVQLEDLKGFMVSSPRGTEIVLSSRLTESQRLYVYTHMLAHLLVGRIGGTISTRFEYLEGKEPSHLSRGERREEAVADALARAILERRMEDIPRYLRLARPFPPAATGLPQRLAHSALALVHWISLALYWRSSAYQRIRSKRAITRLATRVEGLVGAA